VGVAVSAEDCHFLHIRKSTLLFAYCETSNISSGLTLLTYNGVKTFA